MSFTLTQVQEFDTDPATGLRRLKAERHYLRLTQAPDTPPVFVQAGGVWAENGDAIAPIPDWVRERLASATPAVRQAVGWPEAPHAPAQHGRSR
jgi:hypothetical protein